MPWPHGTGDKPTQAHQDTTCHARVQRVDRRCSSAGLPLSRRANDSDHASKLIDDEYLTPSMPLSKSLLGQSVGQSFTVVPSTEQCPRESTGGRAVQRHFSRLESTCTLHPLSSSRRVYRLPRHPSLVHLASCLHAQMRLCRGQISGLQPFFFYFYRMGKC